VNYTVSDLSLSTCWYSNDTYLVNTTLASCANLTTITWSQGLHNVTIYANGTSNNVNQSSVSFRIDTVSPDVNITYPINKTNSSNSQLNVNFTTSDINLASCWYSNDTYLVNTTLASCANITTVTWSNSLHNVTVYVNDSAGNENKSSISFRVDATNTNSPTVELLDPPDASSYSASSQEIVFGYNLSDTNLVSNCSLNIGGVVNSTNNTPILNGINNFTVTFGAGSYNWNVNCTDDGSNVGNSSIRTFTITAPSSGGGGSGGGGSGGGGSGGGGGGSSIRPLANFELDKTLIEVTLSKGKSKQEELILTNTGRSSQTYQILISESLKDLIFIPEDNFVVEKGQTETILINFITSENIKSGVYFGSIDIISDSVTKKVSIIFTIQEKENLFDISLKIPNKYKKLLPGEELLLQLDIYNLGEVGKVDVELEYLVKDIEGNLIMHQNEFAAIETSLSKYQTLDLPSDISIGDYVVIVNVKYGDFSSPVSAKFKVVRNKVDWITILIVVSLILVLFGLLWFFVKRFL
jgi:uncharacterized membrane protein YgcG